MPLHKYPPRIWEMLKMKQGIYARSPSTICARCRRRGHPPQSTGSL
uniref:Uncharacterized protein n=1 Tax=Anguilla anguilla TaxID=7936 RepID=A0A0E9PLX2_ANGAN